MNIAIQADNFELSSDMAAYIERRLRFGLTRYDSDVNRLDVTISRFLAPGQVYCTRTAIRVQMKYIDDIEVEDVERALDHAVDRAIDRAARAVKQRMLTQQTGRRADRSANVM
ncbi:MAG: HPF/RaiA family ribosome-associated protein [Gammaproteobacteria bacterium]|nr:HPF/RaiA family ribosome-associated protein [Gammaproteobacteria bacterium]